jgi:hypothetical protein
MASAGIVIENLSAFRSDLRRALGTAPVALAAGLKAAGEPVKQAASAAAPRISGALASGYGVSVRATTGSVTSAVPYGGGAEWGQRGKWSGFTRYGAPGSRFAGRAIAEREDEIARILDAALRDIIDIMGWAS